ncbi:hypothetical protein EVAR_43659_1 [Eumeta japonica]|uniref:Uncharacterized protein n=1 Tax=Eumeta variegata TaxID=151549 RepID=A0A4C1XTS3_EUMVA|nr:hypothetical protein EVAR_43659_1 [Eumeta japonica]
MARDRPTRGREPRQSLQYDRESMYRAHVAFMRKMCKVHGHATSIKMYATHMCRKGPQSPPGGYPRLPEFIRPSRKLKVVYHTYSLKKERQFRVTLRGVPTELPIEEVKEDHLAQNLPVQSMRQITYRAREPLDLVLVSANTPAVDNAFRLLRPRCAERPRSRQICRT